MKCVVHSLFECSPIEIYKQIKKVYGESAMNEPSVGKWYIMFNEHRTNVHDDERSGRPSLITDELKKQMDDKFLEVDVSP